MGSGSPSQSMSTFYVNPTHKEYTKFVTYSYNFYLTLNILKRLRSVFLGKCTDIQKQKGGGSKEKKRTYSSGLFLECRTRRERVVTIMPALSFQSPFHSP